MTYRKELKFRFQAELADLVQADLVSKGAVYLHPDREVNSIYFDNVKDESYLDSEEGLLPRKKIRARWYNDQKEELCWETKISSFEGRFKTICKLPLPTLQQYKEHGFMDDMYGLMHPITKVSYLRSYFKLREFRFTLDRNIKYYNIKSGVVKVDHECVVELKADIAADVEFGSSLMGYPLARFSKYSNSIAYTSLTR